MDVCEILKKKQAMPEDALAAFQECGLENAASVVRLREGDHLVRDGNWVGSRYVLLEGAVREYRTDQSNRILTDRIVSAAGQTLLPTFDGSGPVSVNVQALIPAMVLSIPTETAEEAVRRDIRLMAFALGILQRHLNEQEQVMNMRSLPSTEERYRWVLEKYGDLARRIDLRTVASFIGTSPENLSRVRSRYELGSGRYRKKSLLT